MVAQTLKLSLSGLSKFDDTCAMQQRFDFPGERFYGLKALLSSRPLQTHTAAVLSGENYNCSETNNLITELSEVAQGLHAAESSR